MTDLCRLDVSRLPEHGIESATLEEARASLLRREGAGAEMLGWMDLPSRKSEELDRLRACAARLREELEILVVVGIGGSYLGARALLEALPAVEGVPRILFAGHHLEASGYEQLLRTLRGRRWGINVISKSGTTTEPAIAFRILRAALEAECGADAARRRIVATTDGESGALRSLAERESYESFVVPDDVGGRFSVLTPVGLLPLAVAGVDVDALLAGAAAELGRCRDAAPLENPAILYAAHRDERYRSGYQIELLASFHPSLSMLAEWWKQLYGESEGKQGRGLFPASVVYTTDLHSMGQYVQEGRRTLIETFLVVEDATSPLSVPVVEDDLDGLNYLGGRSVAEINRLAFDAVAQAHAEGGVQVMSIHLPRLDARCLGGLVYFFEFAVAMAGRLAGVNPFDQPGVEAYKRRLFQLLGKPGH